MAVLGVHPVPVVDRSRRLVVLAPGEHPGQAADAVPLLANPLWGGEGGGVVDHRASAESGSCDEGDGTVCGRRQATLQVQVPQRLSLPVTEVLRPPKRSPIEHDDVETRRGEDRSGDTAAGSRSDHHDVALPVGVPVEHHRDHGTGVGGIRQVRPRVPHGIPEWPPVPPRGRIGVEDP